MIKLEDLPEKLRKQAERKLGASYNKYGASKTVIDGIKFDSKKEADFYAELKLLEKAEVISDLVLQPVFVLQDAFVCKGKKIRAITYVADFKYRQGDKTVVVDVKGMRTDVYKLKRKLFLKRYGDQVDFREV